MLFSYWSKIYNIDSVVGDTSSHLLAVDVSLVESNECKSLLGTSRQVPYGIDTETMICAGEKQGGKDACSVSSCFL